MEPNRCSLYFSLDYKYMHRTHNGALEKTISYSSFLGEKSFAWLVCWHSCRADIDQRHIIQLLGQCWLHYLGKGVVYLSHSLAWTLSIYLDVHVLPSSSANWFPVNQHTVLHTSCYTPDIADHTVSLQPTLHPAIAHLTRTSFQL